jgi:hypothetical protein
MNLANTKEAYSRFTKKDSEKEKKEIRRGISEVARLKSVEKEKEKFEI